MIYYYTSPAGLIVPRQPGWHVFASSNDNPLDRCGVSVLIPHYLPTHRHSHSHTHTQAHTHRHTHRYNMWNTHIRWGQTHSLCIFPFNLHGSFRLKLTLVNPKAQGHFSQLLVRWWKIYSHKVPVGVHIHWASDRRWQQPLRPRGWWPRWLSSGDLPLNFFYSRTLVRHTTKPTGWRLLHQVKADYIISGAVCKQPEGASHFRSAVILPETLITIPVRY